MLNDIEKAVAEHTKSKEGLNCVKPPVRVGRLLDHSPLQELGADIRFPGLGTEENCEKSERLRSKYLVE